MLAYYFPPDSSSGSFRPFFFANHLQKLGAEITVLTVSENDFLAEQPVNYDFIGKLDYKIDVIRTSAWRPREFLIKVKNKFTFGNRNNEQNGFITSTVNPKKISFIQKIKDSITDLLAFPDPHVGWIPGAFRKGREIIREKDIDVIWATGSPWSCLVTGVLLRWKTGCPLVLDFRDPWVANPNFIRHSSLVAFLSRRLERFLVMRNEAIIANTEELSEDFIKRYSLPKDKIHTITNGFEEYIYGNVTSRRNTQFTIVHAGALYFSRNPKNFLEAVNQLIAEKSIDPDLIKIKFVGGISIVDQSLDKLLSNSILQRVVENIPRVAFEKAMEYQIAADVLLLIQPGFPLQVPRKLFDYLAMNRPVLAITENQSATANIIQNFELGRVVGNDVFSLKKEILSMYICWQKGKDIITPEGLGIVFQNKNITQKLYGVLSSVISSN